MPLVTVTITNNSGTIALAQYRTVSVVLDHAALVAAKRSRADGLDLGIRYVGADTPGAERDLVVHVEDPNTATTRVWFALRAQIAASGSSNAYRLRFGNLGALDRVAIPIRDKSQFHPWAAVELPHEQRVQPFLFFDDFGYRMLNGSLEAYPMPAALDASAYDIAGTWSVVDSGGGVPMLRSQMQSNAWARLNTGAVDWDLALVARVRVRAAAGAAALAAGPALQHNGAALDCYYCGPATYTLGAIADFQGGTATPRATAAVTDVTGRWIDVVVALAQNGSGHDLIGTVDGVVVGPWTDAAPIHAAGAPAIIDDSGGGAGPVDFAYLRVELWDGAADPTVALSSIPAPAMPDPSFEVEIGAATASLTDRYPDFKSLRARRLHQMPRAQIPLEFRDVRADEWFDLQALYRTQEPFTVTPPGAAAGSYAIVPGTFNAWQESDESYHARLTLEAVP